MRDEPRYGEVYAYRTLKPWLAVVFRRHFAYVGKTRNPGMRDLEHRAGGGRYGQTAKDWADLDPRRYVVWSSPDVRDWRLSLMEWIFIRILLPVYNVQHNTGNPRRVKPWKAKEYRAARRRGIPRHLSVRPTHVILAITITAIAIGALR